jgi:hypothetical protein
MHSWKSKQRYQYHDHYGYVERRADNYYIGRNPVDHVWARSIYVAEESRRTTMGRPYLYGASERVENHGIRLPARLWQKLGQPYSSNIATLIEERTNV